MDTAFISFHDLSPMGHYQYASPSIEFVLGYHPSEVIGLPAYDFFHPDEIPAVQVLHAQNLAQRKVAVVIHLRMRHKLGHYVKVSCVSNVTSSGIVGSTRCIMENTPDELPFTSKEFHVIETNGLIVTKSWYNSNNDSNSTATVLRTHQPDKPLNCFHNPDTWNASNSNTRTCLLIDRFTNDFKIVFASSESVNVFDLEPNHICGTSFLDLVDNKTRETVRGEMTQAKAMDAICHLRFHMHALFYKSSLTATTPPPIIEVVLLCTSDALVAIARRAIITQSGNPPSYTVPDSSQSNYNHPSIPPPVPVYTPGQSLVLLNGKTNEPQYLDFARNYWDSCTDESSSQPTDDDHDDETTSIGSSVIVNASPDLAYKKSIPMARVNGMPEDMDIDRTQTELLENSYPPYPHPEIISQNHDINSWYNDEVLDRHNDHIYMSDGSLNKNGSFMPPVTMNYPNPLPFSPPTMHYAYSTPLMPLGQRVELDFIPNLSSSQLLHHPHFNSESYADINQVTTNPQVRVIRYDDMEELTRRNSSC